MLETIKQFAMVGIIASTSIVSGAAVAQSLTDAVDPSSLVDLPVDPSVDVIGLTSLDVPDVDLTDLSGFNSVRDTFESALVNFDFNGDGVPGDISSFAELRDMFAVQREDGTFDPSLFADLRTQFEALQADGALPDFHNIILEGFEHGDLANGGYGFDLSQIATLHDALEGQDLGGFDLSALSGLAGPDGGFDLSALSGLAGPDGGFDLSALSGLAGPDGGFDLSAFSALNGVEGVEGFDLGSIFEGLEGHAR